MTSTAPEHATAASVEAVDGDNSTREALREHGIVATQHTSYEWNGYRYTNSGDAIAAAKRSKR
jgi:hypothetical protein